MCGGDLDNTSANKGFCRKPGFFQIDNWLYFQLKGREYFAKSYLFQMKMIRGDTFDCVSERMADLQITSGEFSSLPLVRD